MGAQKVNLNLNNLYYFFFNPNSEHLSENDKTNVKIAIVVGSIFTALILPAVAGAIYLKNSKSYSKELKKLGDNKNIYEKVENLNKGALGNVRYDVSPDTIENAMNEMNELLDKLNKNPTNKAQLIERCEKLLGLMNSTFDQIQDKDRKDNIHSEIIDLQGRLDDFIEEPTTSIKSLPDKAQQVDEREKISSALNKLLDDAKESPNDLRPLIKNSPFLMGRLYFIMGQADGNEQAKLKANIINIQNKFNKLVPTNSPIKPDLNRQNPTIQS